MQKKYPWHTDSPQNKYLRAYTVPGTEPREVWQRSVAEIIYSGEQSKQHVDYHPVECQILSKEGETGKERTKVVGWS